MGLQGLRTHTCRYKSEYRRTGDYLELRHIDTNPNIKGYPNISYEISLLEISTYI